MEYESPNPAVRAYDQIADLQRENARLHEDLWITLKAGLGHMEKCELLEAANLELRTAGDALDNYTEHLEHCLFSGSPHCVCGLGEKVAAWEKAKGKQ